MKNLKCTVLALCVGAFMGGKVFAQVPNYVPTNGLVGWWPFNGNANDESGNGNNGTVNGATLTTDRFGVAGKAYNFISDNQKIDCGASSTLGLTQSNNLTISYWTFSANSSYPYIYKYQNNSPNSNYGLGNVSSNMLVTGLGNTASTFNISNKVWNHICVVFKGTINSVDIFVNGVLTNTFNLTYSPTISTSNLIFGPRFNPCCSYQSPNGNLDDIGMWNRILTQQEISNLYNSKLVNGEVQSWNEVITPIKINPNPTGGSQNVFFNKNYTLFDQKTNEPIYPVNKNGTIVYQIYYTSNEDPKPYYGEFTPEKLEKHLYYKFKNYNNCKNWCDEIELNKKQNSKNNPASKNSGNINTSSSENTNNVTKMDNQDELKKPYKCKCCGSIINGLYEGFDRDGSEWDRFQSEIWFNMYPMSNKLNSISFNRPYENAYDYMRRSCYPMCSINCSKICKE
jgi:hypothetical protein